MNPVRSLGVRWLFFRLRNGQSISPARLMSVWSEAAESNECAVRREIIDGAGYSRRHCSSQWCHISTSSISPVAPHAGHVSVVPDGLVLMPSSCVIDERKPQLLQVDRN